MAKRNLQLNVKAPKHNFIWKTKEHHSPSQTNFISNMCENQLAGRSCRPDSLSTTLPHEAVEAYHQVLFGQPGRVDVIDPLA